MKDELGAPGEPYATAAQEGLRALAEAHRSCIVAASTRRLTGSIDLDETLAKDPAHAAANRWDYGIGFREARGDRRCAVWVKVHPANSGEVDVMLCKA